MQPAHPTCDNDVEKHVEVFIESSPNPRLPGAWSSVCHETRLLLRSIRLGIVITVFQGFFTTKNFLEPEKIALRKSRISAILKTLVHALPLTIAFFEIFLNWEGRYVGKSFNKQNYLQFVAKGHEITMQASVATILLSFIRYQITIGQGMPFGAVLGGLEFLHASYLWSMEFWSSILSKTFHLKSKLVFVILILLCSTIAITAGPSSANLLLARQGIWPIGSAFLAVDATFTDLWPSQLDGSSVSRDCLMTNSIGFKSSCIMPYFMEFVIRIPDIDADPEELVVVTFTPPETSYTMELAVSYCLSTEKNQVCASSSHQQPLNGLIEATYAVQPVWKDVLESYQTIKENYYQPYTIASCVADVIEDEEDQGLLQFARISETVAEPKKDRVILPVPGLKKGQILKERDVNGLFHHYVIWVDLPEDIFNTAVPGVIILQTQGSQALSPEQDHDSSISSYNITTCTLNAGWGSSAVMTNLIGKNVVRSKIVKVPSFWPHRSLVNDAYGFVHSSYPNFAKTSHFSYPQQRINISKTWMEFLNPVLLSQFGDSRDTIISRYLSSLKHQPSEQQMAQMWNTLLAFGLSTIGVQRESQVFFDSKIAHAAYCDRCLVFEIENSVYGWIYTSQNPSTKIAMIVMLIYCVLVLGHITYSATTGISSSAWDSTAELVALAMNSSPTEVLQNTCAGIIGRRVLASSVRVLVKDKGHLELVFDETGTGTGTGTKLIMNEKYGKLATRHDENNDVSSPSTKSDGLDKAGKSGGLEGNGSKIKRW